MQFGPRHRRLQAATFGAARYLNTISPSSNRLSSTTGPAPAKRNAYDAAGNLISDGTVSYAYGNDGRLSGVVAGGIATGYRYNALGQRVAKARAAGVAVHYAYDESGRLLGEYDGAGKAIQEKVYLDDLPVAVLKQGSASAGVNQSAAGHVYYVYADHLGAPRVITRASDNRMVWRWDHADPFGVDQPDENPGKLGVFVYNPRFPGQVFDKETNNHYNYFRDYDPQTGRYIQSDPIGLNINDENDDGYDPDTNIIDWDPNSALCLKDNDRNPTGESQSPAMGLGHELDHTANMPRGVWYKRRTRPYGTPEEQRVIEGAEASAVSTLGEGARHNHYGTPTRVSSPTRRPENCECKK